MGKTQMRGTPSRLCSLRALTFLPLLYLALVSGCRIRQEYLPGGDIQTGIASWYGEEFHGKMTSSREVYDMRDLTAAHNTLPLGSYVMVTNLNNGKSVAVRINDRGPFTKNRVIDLSYAAAKALDMIAPGTAPVRIEVLRKISPPASGLKFSVQVGSFVSKENALALQKELTQYFRDVTLSSFATARQVFYRVRVRAKSREDAQAIGRALVDRGYTAIIFEDR